MAFGDNCFEQISSSLCGFFDSPFGAVLAPFDAVFGNLTLVIVYGLILGALWLRTENLMLVGIVGVLISSTAVGLYEPAQGMGLLLLGVALGITIYQLVRHKVQTFA